MEPANVFESFSEPEIAADSGTREMTFAVSDIASQRNMLRLAQADPDRLREAYVLTLEAVHTFEKEIRRATCLLEELRSLPGGAEIAEEVESAWA